MGNANILQETLQMSAELDVLHRYITEKNLPVLKKDGFDEQCMALEAYLDENVFTMNCKKMNRVNIFSGAMAVPFLLLALIVYFARPSGVDENILVYIIHNPWIIVLMGIFLLMIFATALYFYAIKRKLYNKIYPQLKQKISALPKQ